MLGLRFRFSSVALTFLLLTIPAPRALAGSNAAGRVFLSWDRAGLQYARGTVAPIGAPLYLHLLGAPDVQQLGVTISWTTDLEEATVPCYSLVSSSAAGADTPADSLCGWATSIAPGLPLLDDPSYTWSIQFPSATGPRDCVRFTVSAAGCDSAKHAVFRAMRVVVVDSQGQADTLMNFNYVLIEPPPSVPLALHAVYPSTLVEGEPTMISIQGEGLQEGAQVSLRQGGLVVQATGVTVLSDHGLSADVNPTFANDIPVDVIVERPNGLTAVLPSGLTQLSSLAAAALLPTPSNAEEAFTQVPTVGPTRQTRLIVEPVSHLGVWPSWLDSSHLLVVKAPGDTIGVIDSAPWSGVGFGTTSDATMTPSWARFGLRTPSYATSVALLMTSGLTFKNSGGNLNDTGKPIASVVVRYADGDSFRTVLQIGTHVRNWTSGTNTCVQPPPTGNSTNSYYDTPPSDAHTTEIYSGPGETGNLNVHYDLQEIELPASKRNKLVIAVEVQAAPVPHRECTNGDHDGTSAVFGLMVWPEFKVSTSNGDTVVHQTQNTGKAYGGYLFGGVPVGTRRTMNANACQISCISMLHNYHGVSWATPDSINTYLRAVRGGFERELIANIVGLSTLGDSVYFTGGAWKNQDWKPGAGSRFLIRARTIQPDCDSSSRLATTDKAKSRMGSARRRSRGDTPPSRAHCSRRFGVYI